MLLSSPANLRVLIIGGGPAGSACAIRLRQHGIGVEIAEKSTFPRPKVCGCCLGGAGLAALEQLGQLEWVADAGVAVRRWVGSFDGRRVEIGLPRGRIISRELLDAQLLQTARSLGAVVHQPCMATVLQQNGDGVAVELQWHRRGRTAAPPSERRLAGRATPTRPAERDPLAERDSLAESYPLAEACQQDEPSESTRTYAAAVVAAGLNAGSLGDELPWLQTPHGPFGVGLTLPADRVVLRDAASSQPGTIYMGCDADGYVGLVVLPDGRVDIAAALNRPSRLNRTPRTGRRGPQHSHGKPGDRVAAILRRSSLAEVSIGPRDGAAATPPLRRRRLAGRGRLIAIGDAAGYIEPFTGEGMAWAMLSGIAAADLIAETKACNSLGETWQRRASRLLESRRRRCRWMTTALRSSLIRHTAGAMLSRFPSLAQPLVVGLDR